MEALGNTVVAGEAPHAGDLLDPFQEGFDEGENRLEAALPEGCDGLEELGDALAAGLFGEVFKAEQLADLLLHGIGRFEWRRPCMIASRELGIRPRPRNSRRAGSPEIHGKVIPHGEVAPIGAVLVLVAAQ